MKLGNEVACKIKLEEIDYGRGLMKLGNEVARSAGCYQEGIRQWAAAHRQCKPYRTGGGQARIIHDRRQDGASIVSLPAGGGHDFSAEDVLILARLSLC